MSIEFQKKLTQLLQSKEKIAVAVSGGADSMALALMLKEYYEGDIVALTVNHKLRDEATIEALQVQKWMENWNIPHHTLVWEGEKPTANIEAVARKKRYQLLCDFCKNNNIKTLLVAHNLTDQAETFLLRLRRSSGLFGLGGMEEVSFYQNIKIVRPLLDVARVSLENYLNAKKQKWVYDSFNDDDRYERVRIRKFMPQLEKIGITPKAITESMKLLQVDKKMIKQKVIKLFESNIKVNPNGFIELDIKLFKEEFSLFIYTISEMFTKLGLEIPRAEKISNLYHNNITTTMTLGGLIFCKKGDKILIAPEYQKVKNKQINIKSGQTINFLGFTITTKFDTLVKVLGSKIDKNIKKTGVPFLIKQVLPYFVSVNGEELVPLVIKDLKCLGLKIEYNPFFNCIDI